MRNILSYLFLISGFICSAQTLREQVAAIQSAAQAQEFVSGHPGSELLMFDAGKDSSALISGLLNSNDIVESAGCLYKVVESSAEFSFRASYVFLDGKKLSKKTIDSLRKVIVAKYKSGTSFSSLVNEYNMDGNRNNGDLGWFTEGQMEEKFETAVRNHKKEDVFTLDIKYREWYYVVLKTFDNTEIKTIRVLKVKL